MKRGSRVETVLQSWSAGLVSDFHDLGRSSSGGQTTRGAVGGRRLSLIYQRLHSDTTEQACSRAFCTTVLLWHGWMPPHLCVIYPGSWLYRSSSGPRRRHSHSAYHWFHRPSKSFRRYPAPRAVGPRSDPYCKGCASFINLRWTRKYCQLVRSHLCRCELFVFVAFRYSPIPILEYSVLSISYCIF